MNEIFRKIAMTTSFIMGSAWSFLAACLLIAFWLIVGPVFHYSETWQMVINTLTTIITFLMVFLIQNTQNRDIKTIQLKLDELIRAVEPARTQLVNLEREPDASLDKLSQEFKELGSQMEEAGQSLENSGAAIKSTSEEIF